MIFKTYFDLDFLIGLVGCVNFRGLLQAFLGGTVDGADVDNPTLKEKTRSHTDLNVNENLKNITYCLIDEQSYRILGKSPNMTIILKLTLDQLYLKSPIH